MYKDRDSGKIPKEIINQEGRPFKDQESGRQTLEKSEFMWKKNHDQESKNKDESESIKEEP